MSRAHPELDVCLQTVPADQEGPSVSRAQLLSSAVLQRIPQEGTQLKSVLKGSEPLTHPTCTSPCGKWGSGTPLLVGTGCLSRLCPLAGGQATTCCPMVKSSQWDQKLSLKRRAVICRRQDGFAPRSQRVLASPLPEAA